MVGTYKQAKNLRPFLNMIEWTPKSLKALRQELGLTVNDIAAAMEVSHPTVRNIEQGKSTAKSFLVHYGLILERYYAYSKNMVPAYRYIGTNSGYSQKIIHNGLMEKARAGL